MTPTEYDLAIVTAERDGAREAYDRMKAERDAALDALHRVRRALGLGGVLGRPETIAESAERRRGLITWESLAREAAFSSREYASSGWPMDDRMGREFAGLALFARLMAIVSRPS